MAEPTSLLLVGGGMWIGHGAAQGTENRERSDRFARDLVELCKRHGLRVEELYSKPPDADTLAVSGALIFSF